MENKNPVVFISYSHDNTQHQDQVLNLSNKLRSEGIDCVLDQYEESPPEGWPRWMESNIRNSDFILLICTETYYNRVMGIEKEGVGLGVRWEGHLIYQQIYNYGSLNTKFIPVILNGENSKFIPDPLQGSTYYNVSISDQFDKLYWRLRGVKTKKPDLGKLIELPSKERRTLFVTGVIDLDLWNKAGWKGVAYMHDYENKEPPLMGLVFSDKEIATKIFKGWIENLGEYDLNNELRISIVEGDVKGEPYGYYVHINNYMENTIKRLESERKDFNLDIFLVVSRIHRMNPEPTSKNLYIFKKRFEIFNSYSLIPCVLHDGNKVEIIDGLRILKKNIEFRHISDIKTKNDPDAALKKEYVQEL